MMEYRIRCTRGEESRFIKFAGKEYRTPSEKEATQIARDLQISAPNMLHKITYTAEPCQ